MEIQDYDKVVQWSYGLAKQWVKEHLLPIGVNSSRTFERYKSNGGYLPSHFPREPHNYFKRKGTWVSFNDFFGFPDHRRNHSHTLPFEDAKELMRKHKQIRNWSDYSAWKPRPKGLPAQPYTVYKDQWQGWEDFLGENYEAPSAFRWSKLNEADVRIIKHQLWMGVPGSVLARAFKVSEMQISRIKSGENWGHIQVKQD